MIDILWLNITVIIILFRQYQPEALYGYETFSLASFHWLQWFNLDLRAKGHQVSSVIYSAVI